MRNILYPFFLLSLLAGVYYFFGENFSPLMQKILLVLGLALAFFVFRGIFLFFFDWIFESFSNLFKTIIAGIVFFLLGMSVWGSLPKNSTEKISDIFFSDTNEKNPISSFGNGVTEKVASLKDTAGEKISDTTKGITNGVEGGVNKVGEALDSALSVRTPSHLLKNIKTVSEESKKKSKKEGQEKNKEITEIKENKKEENKQIQNPENSDEKISGWKKPVIAYLPEQEEEKREKSEELEKNNSDALKNSGNKNAETENKDLKIVVTQNTNTSENTKNTENSTKQKLAAEKTNSNITKMKQSGIHLISSGARPEDYTVVLRETDAQIVFPVEYIVSQVLWTDSENTLDQVDFNVLTPEETTAKVSIALSESGATFQKYFDAFENNTTEENKFFISKTSENSRTYATFFEGILWEITISLEGERFVDQDFYNILLPISFEKGE